MTETTSPTDPALVATVTKALAKKTFCNLATSSAANRPHVAGVLYGTVGTTLYMSTSRDSRKARNVEANPHVGVVVPVRKLPVGPPYSIQFQGTARLLELDDPDILRHVAAGHLKSVTGHGELELPGGCFIEVTPNRRVFTYGLGIPTLQMIRHPLEGGRVVELP